MEPFAEIPASELKRRLDAGEPTAILDVREPWEHEICAIPGARLIPMDQLPARVGEIDPKREVIVHCHHGQRSAAVVEELQVECAEDVDVGRFIGRIAGLPAAHVVLVAERTMRVEGHLARLGFSP